MPRKLRIIKYLILEVMKKCLVCIAVIAMTVVLFASCGKECVCKTTRITATMNDSRVDEMGKMPEKDCLEYNGTVNDGEGVVRTIDCHLE